MESEQCTPSVIARLMGLDEKPPLQTVQNSKRVLSENYLRKIASIGVREKCSTHSLSLNSCDQREFKDVFKSDSKDRQAYLRCLQKFENGFSRSSNGELSFCKFEKSQLVSRSRTCFPNSRIVFFKVKHQNYEDSVRCFSAPSSNEALYPGEGKGRRNLFHSVKPIGDRPKVTRQMLNEFSPRNRSRIISISRKVSRLGSGSKLLPPFSNFSYWKSQQKCYAHFDRFYKVSEAKKQLFERWKKTKKSEEVDLASRSSMVGKICGMHDHYSRTINHRPGRWGKKNHEKSVGSKQDKSSKDNFKPNYPNYLKVKDSMVLDESKYTYKEDQSVLNFMSPRSSCSTSYFDLEDNSHSQGTLMITDEMKNELNKNTIASPCLDADADADTETDFLVTPYGKPKNELAKGGDYPSLVMDTTLQQEMSIGSSEEFPVFSHCSMMHSNSLVSLEEAYQPSPVSVLESFSFECLAWARNDICGMWTHLELPKSDISDTYSEGSGMNVSSDDETEEGSTSKFKVKEDLLRSCSIEESRNFSYLVDVLTEAGFHSKNLRTDFGAWHSPESPINLSVFDTLEKKYGDQVSWKRSERKLLFDCINAGLIEILLPCMGVPAWEQSVSRRLIPYPNEVMIEEDLWMLLVRQEKETSKDLAKLIENEIKSDLREDIDAIGRNIEGLLIDELVAEFVSI